MLIRGGGNILLSKCLWHGRRNDSTQVGFIGLGNMGMSMAKNLLKHGNKLVVYDLNKSAMDEFASLGVKTARSPRDVASEVDVLFSMVPAARHVRALYSGDRGVFSGGRKNALFVDCSTIDPITSQAVAKEAQELGFRMVDAPVSGGVVGAINATLTFMVGGEAENVNEARGYLAQMGKKIVHCGPQGMGAAVKVCNNLILGVSMIGVAEGYKLAKRLGVDMKTFADVVNTSSGRCWSSDSYCPVPGVLDNVPATRNYVGGFAVDLMVKDLQLAEESAKVNDCYIPMTNKAKDLYSALSSSGLGQRDFGCIYEFEDKCKEHLQ